MTDPDLEQAADEADVAEQQEEWTADPEEQPVVPDEDRLVAVEEDDS